MKAFTYNALPARVIFGQGTSQTKVASEVDHLGCSKALVLTTPYQIQQGESVKAALENRYAGMYTNATMHTPTEVTEEALKYAESIQADCVVAVGGGSTIGLGKALALASKGRLKQIAIPTTYAGSEVTPIIGQTSKGLKTTQKTTVVLPQAVIYDVDLTLTLPLAMTVTSGINAVAHAVEALYSTEANPIIDMLAVSGIENIAQALPSLMKNAQDVDARAQAQYGAWACGTCLGSVGMSIHHKLCHTLGGSFNMPHAETHTVILPHAIQYNSDYAKEAMQKIAGALGSDDAARGVFDLSKSNGGPTSLKELGFKEEDLEKAADIAVSNPYANPAPLERGKLLQLLRNAYEGKRP